MGRVVDKWNLLSFHFCNFAFDLDYSSAESQKEGVYRLRTTLVRFCKRLQCYYAVAGRESTEYSRLQCQLILLGKLVQQCRLSLLTLYHYTRAPLWSCSSLSLHASFFALDLPRQHTMELCNPLISVHYPFLFKNNSKQ